MTYSLLLKALVALVTMGTGAAHERHESTAEQTVDMIEIHQIHRNDKESSISYTYVLLYKTDAATGKLREIGRKYSRWPVYVRKVGNCYVVDGNYDADTPRPLQFRSLDFRVTMATWEYDWLPEPSLWENYLSDPYDAFHAPPKKHLRYRKIEDTLPNSGVE